MLGGIPVEYLTPSALIGLAIFFIFTGRLVPKRFYQEKVNESDRWRLAYEVQRERADKSDAQTAELLEVTKTTHAFIVAIFHSTGAPHPTPQIGGANVVS